MCMLQEAVTFFTNMGKLSISSISQMGNLLDVGDNAFGRTIVIGLSRKSY